VNKTDVCLQITAQMDPEKPSKFRAFCLFATTKGKKKIERTFSFCLDNKSHYISKK
jgi:hypothetical protein